MNDVILLDTIELSDYYKKAEEVTKYILGKELERTKKNLKKLKNKGVKFDDQYLMDQVHKSILQVSIIVTTAISKRVLNIIQEAEEIVIKEKLGITGDLNDYSR